MTYLRFFADGLAAYPASITDCPYPPLTVAALAWLDGLAAAKDRASHDGIWGATLCFAVDHKPSLTRIAIERYAGRALIRAAETPGCDVTVLQINGHVFDPDLWPGIENPGRVSSYAGQNFDAANPDGDDDDDVIEDEP